MNNNIWLKRCVEAVVFLFTAFGGFLSNIAPPDDRFGNFAVGSASIVLLILALFIIARVRTHNQSDIDHKAFWFRMAKKAGLLTLAMIFAYWLAYQLCTFSDMGGQTHVKGFAYTVVAKKVVEERPGLSDAMLVSGMGSDPLRVWKTYSILINGALLLGLYLGLVLAVGTALFSVTEGVLAHTPPSKHDARQPRQSPQQSPQDTH